MEKESFTNKAIAEILNRDYVCIKVDREERPDLDEIYMKAVLLLNDGNGGWPMSVFLTPDRKPFFGGTYYPPENKYGRPGFKTLINRISDYWKKNSNGICVWKFWCTAEPAVHRVKGILQVFT